MSGELRETDWEILVERVRGGKCTPFLGAGAGYGVLPLGGELAKKWAKEYAYPLPDKSNLIAVSQFMALQYDPMFVKEKLVKTFERLPRPNFDDPLETHRVLAGLPVALYLTTNYDDFMTEALKRNLRAAVRAPCQWNRATADHVRDNPTPFDEDPALRPRPESPLVFHLHGYVPAPESLVLTEDDYLEFLANMSSASVLPPAVERALATTSLLFIGYRLADWNFRVILRSFFKYNLKNLNVAVMPAPKAAGGRQTAEQQKRSQEYMTKYYENLDVRIYWGTAKEFLRELKRRLG